VNNFAAQIRHFHLRPMHEEFVIDISKFLGFDKTKSSTMPSSKSTYWERTNIGNVARVADGGLKQTSPTT
jgi:hypothetical protein